MAAARAQRLLCRPERVVAVLRADDQQVHEVDARGRKSRGIRHVRRCDPHRALSCARQRSQRRKDEPQLANASPFVQHLAKRLAWPAATGQLGLKGGKAGGQDGNGPGERAAAPDGMLLQDCVEDGHTVFSYSTGLRGKTPYLPDFSLRICAW